LPFLYFCYKKNIPYYKDSLRSSAYFHRTSNAFILFLSKFDTSIDCWSKKICSYYFCYFLTSTLFLKCFKDVSFIQNLLNEYRPLKCPPISTRLQGAKSRRQCSSYRLSVTSVVYIPNELDVSSVMCYRKRMTKRSFSSAPHSLFEKVDQVRWVLDRK
jgi:hypothetical protein